MNFKNRETAQSPAELERNERMKSIATKGNKVGQQQAEDSSRTFASAVKDTTALVQTRVPKAVHQKLKMLALQREEKICDILSKVITDYVNSQKLGALPL